MIADISVHGKIAIRLFLPTAKCTPTVISKKVLKPLFAKDILRLYGDKAKCVALRHDSATAHKASPTV